MGAASGGGAIFSDELMLSQRLRGIGHAPKDFDYKKELEDRF